MLSCQSINLICGDTQSILQELFHEYSYLFNEIWYNIAIDCIRFISSNESSSNLWPSITNELDVNRGGLSYKPYVNHSYFNLNTCVYTLVGSTIINQANAANRNSTQRLTLLYVLFSEYSFKLRNELSRSFLDSYDRRIFLEYSSCKEYIVVLAYIIKSLSLIISNDSNNASITSINQILLHLSEIYSLIDFNITTAPLYLSIIEYFNSISNYYNNNRGNINEVDLLEVFRHQIILFQQVIPQLFDPVDSKICNTLPSVHTKPTSDNLKDLYDYLTKLSSINSNVLINLLNSLTDITLCLSANSHYQSVYLYTLSIFRSIILPVCMIDKYHTIYLSAIQAHLSKLFNDAIERDIDSKIVKNLPNQIIEILLEIKVDILTDIQLSSFVHGVLELWVNLAKCYTQQVEIPIPSGLNVLFLSNNLSINYLTIILQYIIKSNQQSDNRAYIYILIFSIYPSIYLLIDNFTVNPLIESFELLIIQFLFIILTILPPNNQLIYLTNLITKFCRILVRYPKLDNMIARYIVKGITTIARNQSSLLKDMIVQLSIEDKLILQNSMKTLIQLENNQLDNQANSQANAGSSLKKIDISRYTK